MTEVIRRAGGLGRSFAEIEGRGWLVFGGQSSFRASGAKAQLAPFLHSGAEFCSIRGPLPTVDEADHLIETFRRRNLLGILAVGGGLVIDTMKIVSLALATGLGARDFVHAPVDVEGMPVDTVAAPTTAGSGAERTPFAVLYDNGVKHSVEDPRLLPKRAIVDPLLTRSVPAPVAASAGLDALAHCVESLWARRSTPQSRTAAVDALEIIVNNLESAVTDRSTRAQDSMALAASEAGACIAATRTTAAHALSYYLTSIHRVAHGHAVALTLGSLIVVNGAVDDSTVTDRRGADHVRESIDTVCRTLGLRSPSEGQEYVRDLVGRLGLASSADEAAGKGVDRTSWVRSVNSERLANNPRVLHESTLLDIVQSA